ncbi:NADH dehydrogenase [ubiquinone] 1 beta subcomplex subunit 5, mitochondrial [Copidosoma floridanum]|uniref:NADH dehydrogenase [ubiquinone] 1 beta subcomplex subunit 5, mitochondrial n=1 Tax=Copidosoma floridanum TaxID=29053 RepID=UPI0006C998C2|nr:NADH dehydrogenase [ubiquinone] 1 beta subcomplex subunit 5, mitochondrial [Copidosoma floridanum]
MAAFSSLLRCSAQNIQNTRLLVPKYSLKTAIQQIPTRGMSHTFTVQASRWQWHKTKDYFHFYTMLAAIPLGIITFCANVFVGPATLTPIPEGYEPEFWEYYRNPITRFLARYIFGTPQKDYEKTVFAVWEADQLRKIRILEQMVYSRMRERQDYQYGYHTPYESFDLRERRESLRRHMDGIHEDEK